MQAAEPGLENEPAAHLETHASSPGAAPTSKAPGLGSNRPPGHSPHVALPVALRFCCSWNHRNVSLLVTEQPQELYFPAGHADDDAGGVVPHAAAQIKLAQYAGRSVVSLWRHLVLPTGAGVGTVKKSARSEYSAAEDAATGSMVGRMRGNF